MRQRVRRRAYGGWRRAGALGAGSLLLLAATACDPPGKPKAEPTRGTEITDFKVLFGENCAGCHGDNGRNGPGRILNDALYLAVIPKATLRDVIANGREGTAMPAWSEKRGGPLTEKQVDALADGIEKWATPVNTRNAPLPHYSEQDAAGATAGNADSGRKLFLRDCFMCHGPGAPVGQLTEAAYLSLVTNQMLRTSIIVGRPDLGMPDYRMLNMGKPLTDQNIADLVAFLSSKRPPDAATAKTTNGTGQPNAGEMQSGSEGAPTNANQSGNARSMTKGNEGSGNGPGSKRKQNGEGNKSTGSSSQRGVK